MTAHDQPTGTHELPKTELVEGNSGAVKSEVFKVCVDTLKEGRQLVSKGASPMEIERFVGKQVGILGQMLVAYFFHVRADERWKKR